MRETAVAPRKKNGSSLMLLPKRWGSGDHRDQQATQLAASSRCGFSLYVADAFLVQFFCVACVLRCSILAVVLAVWTLKGKGIDGIIHTYWLCDDCTLLGVIYYDIMTKTT